MQTPNRQKIPPVKPVEKIDYVRAEKKVLSNGIPLYLINAGTQDIIRIELLFEAGSWFETTPLLASATNAMLIEGTEYRTSEMIAESFEYYGAFFQVNADKDFPTWGIIALSMAQDVAAGKPVPAFVDTGVVPVIGADAARKMIEERKANQ